jgi:hypothetical protein
VTLRRLAIAAILAVCLGAPVAEMFDQWDHTYQDGNDTEANVVVVALCVGVALSVAGVFAARIRALSSRSAVHIFACAPDRVTGSFFTIPIPTGSPPTPLRV